MYSCQQSFQRPGLVMHPPNPEYRQRPIGSSLEDAARIAYERHKLSYEARGQELPSGRYHVSGEERVYISQAMHGEGDE